MKDKFVKKVQGYLIKISLRSIGRSIPMCVYEKEIPEAVLKFRNKRNK